MYKKILSLVLVLVLALSCFVLSVSAYTPSLESVFENAFIWYNKEKGSTVDEESLYIRRIGLAGKYDVYRAYFGEIIPLESQQIIGGYIFTYGSLVGDEETNPTGLYAFNGSELMTLKEAYDKGLVDLDLLYEKVGDNHKMSPLSDEEILKKKCREAYAKKFDVPDSFEFPVTVDFAVKFENYTVFRAHHLAPPQMPTHQYIDGYWFYTPCIWGNDDNNPTGLYTLDNYGNVQSLAETVSEGFIETDDIFEAVSVKCEMYLRGDIDGDKELTVKDATLIQKYLAKVPEAVKTVNSHPLGAYVMDTELNFATTPEVNIKDATYIQKKVAKIIVESDRQPFEYGEILVFVDGVDTPEYTLEDFPEYAFTGIEVQKLNALKLTMIKLKFEAEGEAGVIDAVNSLKHREGTEFKSVSPNALFYPD